MAIENHIRTFGGLTAGALALAGFAAPAAAAGTNATTMDVGATVDGRCTVSTTDMAFGLLDTQNITRKDSTATVTVGCVGILSLFRVEIDWGQNANGEQRRLKNGSGDYLRYEVYRNTQRTQRWGRRTNETVSGIVLLGIGNRTYQAYGRLTGITPATAPGRYTDQLTVTVNF